MANIDSASKSSTLTFAKSYRRNNKRSLHLSSGAKAGIWEEYFYYYFYFLLRKETVLLMELSITMRTSWTGCVELAKTRNCIEEITK